MKQYFEGWYYKQQKGRETLAIIPGRSTNEAFIQIITEKQSYHIPYTLADYHRDGNYCLRIGNSFFSPYGITLDTHSKEVSLAGKLRFRNHVPIDGDIMGPFRLFPMECRHGIVSLRHDIQGTIELNGNTSDYCSGIGYIETDCGRSFPTDYTWIQCNDFPFPCSVFASIALIPWGGLCFWGCICIVWLQGYEYRLATYKGAHILRCEQNRLSLKQGAYLLDIQVKTPISMPLYAPASGQMQRIIHESASCQAHFRFCNGDQVLLDKTSEYASYEYAKTTSHKNGVAFSRPSSPAPGRPLK